MIFAWDSGLQLKEFIGVIYFGIYVTSNIVYTLKGVFATSEGRRSSKHG